MKLSYHPGVPERFIEEMERAARRLGLPLDKVELIGQDPKVARDFLRAVRSGKGAAFVDGLDERALERLLAARELGKRSPAPKGVRDVA